MRAFVGAMLLAAASASGQDCPGWSQRSPDISPPGLLSEPMAYDTARAVSIFYQRPKTWGWAGAEWTVLFEDGPSSFGGYGMAYDSVRRATVLYGGTGGNGDDLGQTWELNGAAWAMQYPANSPGLRSDTAMAYDSKRGVMVLFGGGHTTDEDFVVFGDTWEWDGETWTKVADTGPDARYFHSMAYDSERSVTVLYGGAGSPQIYSDTWEWDGKAWSLRDTFGFGNRVRAAMVYDADLHACVLFGGYRDNSVMNDTWAWDGQTWTNLDTPDAPSPRADHAMAYDSARHAIVLFGGKDNFGNILDDTWEFSCSPPPCYPDLDGNGALDLFDFLAFVNLFNASDSTADCDGDGAFTLFDFLCFTNVFNAGC